MRTKSLKTLAREAWKLCATYIKIRDDWRCYTCGKQAFHSPTINAGHLFPDTHSNTRYDSLNIHAQCVRCNKYLHGNLHKYIIRFLNDFGLPAYEYLSVRSCKPYKYTKETLLDVQVRYHHELVTIFPEKYHAYENRFGSKKIERKHEKRKN